MSQSAQDDVFPELVQFVKDAELLMRVNAPMVDGCPMHKSALAIIEKIPPEVRP